MGGKSKPNVRDVRRYNSCSYDSRDLRETTVNIAALALVVSKYVALSQSAATVLKISELSYF